MGEKLVVCFVITPMLIEPCYLIVTSSRHHQGTDCITGSPLAKKAFLACLCNYKPPIIS